MAHWALVAPVSREQPLAAFARRDRSLRMLPARTFMAMAVVVSIRRIDAAQARLQLCNKPCP